MIIDPMKYRLQVPTGHLVTGNTVSGDYINELHRHTQILTANTHAGKKHYGQVAVANYPEQIIDLDMLDAASEVYKISPNVEDYIMIPIPIVTVDIPNRNLQAAPLEEIAHFDHNQGSLVYQTFNWKGLFSEHAHDNPLESKGLIVDSVVRHIPKYDLWKICIVTLWDRTKDVQLVNDIISGKINGYSMGAFCQAFLCSICGKEDPMNASSCEHMKKNKKGTTWGKEKRLSYQVMAGIQYFETSAVGQPADNTAISNDVYR